MSKMINFKPLNGGIIGSMLEDERMVVDVLGANKRNILSAMFHKKYITADEYVKACKCLTNAKFQLIWL